MNTIQTYLYNHPVTPEDYKGITDCVKEISRNEIIEVMKKNIRFQNLSNDDLIDEFVAVNWAWPKPHIKEK